MRLRNNPSPEKNSYNKQRRSLPHCGRNVFFYRITCRLFIGSFSFGDKENKDNQQRIGKVKEYFAKNASDEIECNEGGGIIRKRYLVCNLHYFKEKSEREAGGKSSEADKGKLFVKLLFRM